MKFCNYCRVQYYPRRSDQKYCSNQCRNRNKNEKTKRENEVFEPAMKIIRKNYEVLQYFAQFEGYIFDLEELLEWGF